MEHLQRQVYLHILNEQELEENILKMMLSDEDKPKSKTDEIFLTTGELFHSLRFQFRISHNYISVFVSDVLTAICKRLKNVLMPAPTEDTWKANSIEFWERWNFPNCVGAIDGKHVRIVCPSKSGSQFFNYKNYFSIVLLAIVDAEYKFTAVDVGSYGREGDSSIFTKSALGKSLYENTINFPQDAALPGSQKVLPFVIVGDEAFRLHKNLMKPYNRVQAKDDFQKAIFNYHLCRARRVSENAFGILCQIFRVFHTPIAVKAKTCDFIILGACLIHNLIRNDARISSHQSNEAGSSTKNMIPLNRSGGFAQSEGFNV
ncbi:uncharacterized protein LOC126885473 [Diabrotica virgifera virgifera]|uniref:DDE Tnp4 domain-containing protein n=1 Tax=Diabrotica virgifera virgifera TaxID=50390 RepID=A0ABM5KCT3_DIAVI|nr:uncharacterized protein LOC126885473 [Diabrotica virgifera virgifera]